MSYYPELNMHNRDKIKVALDLPNNATKKNKAGFSPLKKEIVISYIESSFNMVKNAFYIISKALFVLKIFNFLSWLFDHVEKTTWLERWGWF